MGSRLPSRLGDMAIVKAESARSRNKDRYLFSRRQLPALSPKSRSRPFRVKAYLLMTTLVHLLVRDNAKGKSTRNDPPIFILTFE